MSDAAPVVETRRFAPQGVICVDPAALEISYRAALPRPAYTIVDGVALVMCDRPLSFADDYFGTYARLLSDCWDAFSDPQSTCVAIAYHSPGGTARGMLTTARALRQLSVDSAKPLISYVVGDACSAAYALACAGDRVVLQSPDAQLGSIGAARGRADQTAADRMAGLRIVYASSGSAKLWGNPHTEITPEEQLAIETEVDTEAARLIAWVSERRGIPVDQIQAMEARCVMGDEALSLGLADAYCESIDKLGSYVRALNSTEVNTMTFADITSALAKVAGATGPDAEAAKLMLAALTPEQEEVKSETPPPAPPAEDEDEDDEDKVPPTSASKSTAGVGATVARKPADSVITDALAAAMQRATELETQLVAMQRERFFEEHSAKISPQLRAVLANKSIDECKVIVDALALKPAPKPGLGPVHATRGKDTSEQLATHRSQPVVARLNSAMGLTARGPRSTRIIAGRTYYDVPADYVPVVGMEDSDQ